MDYSAKNSTTEDGASYLNRSQQIVITLLYLLGIFGNLVALIFLFKKKTRPKNQRHKFLLKCQSANDLTALLGMLILMYMKLYLKLDQNIWVCRFRIFWRVFGIGSGCVTAAMAVERWLALTKPFFYQKHMTAALLRRSILGLWCSAVALVCMPFFGFGLYYDFEKKQCKRYRDATKLLDIAYAYLYVFVGILLCMCIVFCNVGVIFSLCFKKIHRYNENSVNNGYNNNNNNNNNNNDNNKQISGGCLSRTKKPVLVRGVSTTSSREEVAFGRLMGFLCVIFVICWMPQLLTIPLVQFKLQFVLNFLGRMPDMLMALHFVLNPYVYVLQRLPTSRRLLSSMRRNRQYNNLPLVYQGATNSCI